MTILFPTPPQPMPDIGPRHRGGWPVALVSLIGSLAALACGSLLARQHPVLALIPALALGGPSAWGWWCVWQAGRDKSLLPRSHSLLAGTLGFDLSCTVRDVAVAAFFLDDRVPSGGVTRLLVFLENYASRRRIALMRIGRHQGLGLPQDQERPSCRSSRR